MKSGEGKASGEAEWCKRGSGVAKEWDKGQMQKRGGGEQEEKG